MDSYIPNVDGTNEIPPKNRDNPSSRRRNNQFPNSDQPASNQLCNPFSVNPRASPPSTSNQQHYQAPPFTPPRLSPNITQQIPVDDRVAFSRVSTLDRDFSYATPNSSPASRLPAAHVDLSTIWNEIPDALPPLTQNDIKAIMNKSNGSSRESGADSDHVLGNVVKGIYRIKMLNLLHDISRLRELHGMVKHGVLQKYIPRAQRKHILTGYDSSSVYGRYVDARTKRTMRCFFRKTSISCKSFWQTPQDREDDWVGAVYLPKRKLVFIAGDKLLQE
ncbi:hypothetical protein EJ08DRAFT_138339 [Tothia fuscella]|uniref:Uncharacterized protein n=1 Tax=Tothia fuscella TaxID=1048955 RepID=A0A9P4U0R1_9PEZI|nr:hypothetical protein EJ08DRAFT_138339 [Tothia fuscella]